MKFITPIIVKYDENESAVCVDFKQYARAMQYPGPTYIEMCAEANEMLTVLVNGGCDPFKVYEAFKGEYSYDEMGREYIPFPAPYEAKKIRQKFLSGNMPES